ncbi:hypothetical protein Vau01_121600 [Virgisporangium aurantiacum]|uniref:CR-type domain-containing protein n=1 Tax=Virgisporangium aurantiacum TaxID=175570 RepID=A0A8J4E7T2_9ACTN|nr:hypothetical protein Vau01_121600 [Virgisporangium aurantiacum]
MSAAMPDAAGSRAVLIGVSAYRTLDDLPAVENNLTTLCAHLTDPTQWGLPADQCHTLHQPDSVDAVLDTLQREAPVVTDTLLVYYAGHGLVDDHDEDELYLALPHSNPVRPHRTAIPYSWLRRELIEATGARQKVVVLDCCYSGRALHRWMSGDGVGDLGNLLDIHGTCVLTATARTRRALAPAGETHTAFTGELLDLLRQGVTQGPELLDLETIYRHLDHRLRSKGRPLPARGQLDHGGMVALGWNVAHPSHQLRELRQVRTDLDAVRAERDELRRLLEVAGKRATDEAEQQIAAARRIRSEAEAEAARVLTDANTEAAHLRAEADAEASRIRADTATAEAKIRQRAADLAELERELDQVREALKRSQWPFPLPRVRPGKDAFVRLELDLAETAFGVEAPITVDTFSMCEACSGSGCAPDTQVTACEGCQGRGDKPPGKPCRLCAGTGSVIPTPCPACRGDGRIEAQRTLRVAVPAGTDSGTRIRLAEQGEVGPGGGTPGDIYVEIIERRHDVFTRTGDDLHCHVALPAPVALAGTRLIIKTLDGQQAAGGEEEADGQEEVTVPPGTQPGTTLRLAGRGMPNLGGEGRGDLFVHLDLRDPKQARLQHGRKRDDRKQHGLFKRIRDAFND